MSSPRNGTETSSPTRTNAQQATSSTPVTTQDPLTRLIQFYDYYAPERTATAPLALKSFEGREEMMFRALEKKYGPESSAVAAAKAREAATKSTTGNSSVKQAAQITPPMPIEPPPPPRIPQIHFNILQARLERFYQYYAPERLDTAQSTLDSFAGREDTMFRVLEKKYGAEPRAFVSLPLSAPSTGARDRGADDGVLGLPIGSQGVVGSTAGPDPKTLPFHTPYDYAVVLQRTPISMRSELVESVLTTFGESKRAYAAALAVVAHAVGPDALFDVDPERVLVFPYSNVVEIKHCKPDALDQLAFTHLSHARAYFVSAVQRVMWVRECESVERSILVQKHLATLRELSYKSLVAEYAFQNLQPIENERREVIKLDERLRFDGLVCWFRHRRVEIVKGIAISGEHDDYDEYGSDDAAATRSPNTSNRGARLPSPRRVKLDDMAAKLHCVNEVLRSKSSTLVARWASSSTDAWDSGHAPYGHMHQRSTSQNDSRRNRSPSQVHAADRAVGAAPPSSATPVKVWLPSGPTTTSAHKNVNLFGAASTQEKSSWDETHTVIREVLYYDPFRSPSATSSAVTSASAAAAQREVDLPRKPKSVLRSQSKNNASDCEGATSQHLLYIDVFGAAPPPVATTSRAGNPITPCAVARMVRLKKVMPRGSFSGVKIASPSGDVAVQRAASTRKA